MIAEQEGESVAKTSAYSSTPYAMERKEKSEKRNKTTGQTGLESLQRRGSPSFGLLWIANKIAEKKRIMLHLRCIKRNAKLLVSAVDYVSRDLSPISEHRNKEEAVQVL